MKSLTINSRYNFLQEAKQKITRIDMELPRYNFLQEAKQKITRIDMELKDRISTDVISSKKMRLFSFFCIEKCIIGIFLFFFFLQTSYACTCPYTSLSKSECNKYDIIFRGEIISVAMCDNKPGLAIFKIKDLYKGMVTDNFKVIFSCDEECSYKFQAGEEWIIYSNYKQVDRAQMDWCSRSRRFIKNEKEDYYAVTNGNSYDSEAKFLQDSLGLHRLLKEQLNPDQLRNQMPSTNQQIIILICSLLCVILFYYLFNKFFK